MAKFRFQDLLIWQRAIIVGNRLIDISEKLEEIKRFRFAEQLRGAALSVSNNIAEG
ncbi:MAG: four helix bundle protein, partial [Flavobacterium sp.]